MVEIRREMFTRNRGNIITALLAIAVIILGILYYRSNNRLAELTSAPPVVQDIVPESRPEQPQPPPTTTPPTPTPPTPPTTPPTSTEETRTLRDAGMANIPSACPVCDGRCYGVQRGDTLSRIARRFYGTTRAVQDLARINNIAGPVYRIYATSCICLPKNIKLSAAPLPRPRAVKRAPKPKLVAPVVVKPVEKVEKPVCPPCPECPACPPVVPPPVTPPPPPPPLPLLLPPPVVPLTPEKPEPETETRLVLPETVTPVPLGPLPDFRVPFRKPFVMPGSLSSTTGNILPAEKGNIISETRVEQGFTAFRKGSFSVMPVASLDTTIDSKGYDWNNKIVTQGGLRAAQTFDHGIVQGDVGYTEERRMRSASRANGITYSGSYWFGWHQPTTADIDPFSAFPGSSWGLIGEVSPVERNNIWGGIYAQQGVIATKIGRSSLIPYGEALLTRDTKGYDWNNRRLLGAGLKLAVPLREGMVIDLGAGYKNEYRPKTDRTYDGISGTVNFWLGWNPPLGK